MAAGMTATGYGRAGATVRYADAAECRVRLMLVLVTIRCICSGIRVIRCGTREGIRSLPERARAAHDYSADISNKVQGGRKRWAGKSYWGGRRPYGE
jgi:hypothetical protein